MWIRPGAGYIRTGSDPVPMEPFNLYLYGSQVKTRLFRFGCTWKDLKQDAKTTILKAILKYHQSVWLVAALSSQLKRYLWLRYSFTSSSLSLLWRRRRRRRRCSRFWVSSRNLCVNSFSLCFCQIFVAAVVKSYGPYTLHPNISHYYLLRIQRIEASGLEKEKKEIWGVYFCTCVSVRACVPVCGSQRCWSLITGGRGWIRESREINGLTHPFPISSHLLLPSRFLSNLRLLAGAAARFSPGCYNLVFPDYFHSFLFAFCVLIFILRPTLFFPPPLFFPFWSYFSNFASAFLLVSPLIFTSSSRLTLVFMFLSCHPPPTHPSLHNCESPAVSSVNHSN